ncbi:hypothetical protein NDU88_004663 [Pleurodeles waltl]|uniref:Uncharacterized protein n=1 Tax=Pleurodeles waltl TaxID=8319 RepID=A0AAV7NMX7_PLEWA|nr:hypothetical protein NDU88_004663 [Pleurodeles waltl]
MGSVDGSPRPRLPLPRPGEANFRSPALKGTTDSGRGGEESSFKKPEKEALVTPRIEREDRQALETPRTEREDRQALERREGGGNQTPETSTSRHDPRGSWLTKVRSLLQVQGKTRMREKTRGGGGEEKEGREDREHD